MVLLMTNFDLKNQVFKSVLTPPVIAGGKEFLLELAVWRGGKAYQPLSFYPPNQW